MGQRDRNHEAYVKGDALYQTGRFTEAAKHFLAALAEDATDYQALWALGNCYAELKRARKAEDSFRRALALCAEAHRAALWFNLGNALLDQQRCAEALEAYRGIPSGHPLSKKERRNAQSAKHQIAAS